jgi:outer membrane protein assembly factor BamB
VKTPGNPTAGTIVIEGKVLSGRACGNNGTACYILALDAKTGKELWKANDGNLHNGGIISYEVNGKQYIATVTGFPSMVSEGYPAMFPDAPYKYMEQNTGALIVYTLE